MQRINGGVDDFMSMLKNLFAKKEMVYISTPINTGKVYAEWYLSVRNKMDTNGLEFMKQRKELVVKKNIQNALEYCSILSRKVENKVIINPVNFENDSLQWEQIDFYNFWSHIIEVLISDIYFMDGWEYSVGCCYELLSALKNNISIYTQDSQMLSLDSAINNIRNSYAFYSQNNMSEADELKSIVNEIEQLCESDNCVMVKLKRSNFLKDEKLDALASNDIANVAQFISFKPGADLEVGFTHISNFNNNEALSAKELIRLLILSAPSESVNIRSFSPASLKGNSLVFNKKIDDIDEILRIVTENCLNGKYSIINENIDINDAGVSGVVLGDIIEFSPEDTPKCVDKEDVCSLPREIGMRIIRTVYGFSPTITFDKNFRVEFSIHPTRQGLMKNHTIIWEYEYFRNFEKGKMIVWPNRFSKFIGDKVFGLLIADAFGFLVPKTLVISRKIAPFSFGISTGLKEKWVRTCPVVKEPGKYYSGNKWVDPFILMENEEAIGDNGINIASILSQDAVEAVYSGVSFIRAIENNDVIEGLRGKGDGFMIGCCDAEELPESVVGAVRRLNNRFRQYMSELGEVSVEWVFDGTNVWVLQLNQLKNATKNEGFRSNVIVSGSPTHYIKVYTKDGLNNLRDVINRIKNQNIGIELIGNVGITSHFGDLLRLANVPSLLLSKTN